MNSILNSMRIERDIVALEASLSQNTQQLLANIFPSIVDEFNGFIGRFMPSTPAIALTSKQFSFLKEITKHNYMDIVSLGAFVPEGLNTTYLKYAEKLMPAAVHASGILSGIISTYSVYLSQLITNKDHKLVTQSFTKVFKELADERESISKDLGKCFKNGSTATDTTIGKVIDRNNDWSKVFHSCNELTKLINIVDRKALNKKVEECSHLLSLIIKKVKQNELENISPQNVENLADGAYAVASELEFFAVTYYKILAYTESINKTIQHFDNVIVQPH